VGPASAASSTASSRIPNIMSTAAATAAAAGTVAGQVQLLRCRCMTLQACCHNPGCALAVAGLLEPCPHSYCPAAPGQRVRQHCPTGPRHPPLGPQVQLAHTLERPG
jgi:hypothetical protein